MRPINNKSSPAVPKLRFPEFKNSGEWQEYQLCNIVDVIDGDRGKNYPKQKDFFNDEYCLFLNAKNVTKTGFIFNEGQFITKERSALLGKGKLKMHDIVLTTRGSIGHFAYYSDDTQYQNIRINSGMVLLRVNSAILLSNYFYKSCSSLQINKQIKTMSFGSAQPQLTVREINKIKIDIPKPAEQQKIADCLSPLDALITTQTQKLQALQQHKKGLMQNLFPAEGKTTPKLRFPEFKNSGEWEIKLIENYFDVGSSKRVLQKDWVSEGIPFYRTRELVSLSKNELFRNEIYIPEKLFQKLSKRYGIPAEGDFLVSGVGTIGVLYQVKACDKFYFKDGNVIWFKLDKELVSDYFKHCFQSQFIQNQIISQTSASTVGTYTIQNARKTKFLLPTIKQEQQKIADCLSSFDALITTQTQKLQALQQHKKGLMQGLFPIQLS